MTLKEIAAELVAGIRDGREAENLDKLYAPDAVSVEAMEMEGGMGRECAGLEGIKGKHAWWDNAMEMVEAEVSDPLLHGDDRFALIFKGQAKEKATGNVMEINEVGVYHVGDGKIVREEFFYTM